MADDLGVAADLTDPAAARTDLAAALAASVPALDPAGMEITDHTVAADPPVVVRLYRPRQAHGAVVWLHGGLVVGDLDTEHPAATRLADGAGWWWCRWATGWPRGLLPRRPGRRLRRAGVDRRAPPSSAPTRRTSRSGA